MKIIKLTLKGYKKFALSNNKEIDIVIDSRLPIITGRNGSGKSSLIRELSPLPANSNDYHKNGSKYIEIEHLGNKYILTSNFDNGSKYSFICNNEELNPGYTVTVYKELVYKHFRLDNNIYSLLCNDTSFIYYSNQERKNWITRISNNDLTYAISYYNKCKEILRDITGSIKLSKIKLLQESEKLIDEDEYKELKFLIDDSNKLIDTLLSIRDNRVIDPAELKNDINTIEERIKTANRELSVMMDSYPTDTNYDNVDELQNYIERLSMKVVTYSNRKKTVEKHLSNLMDNIETLKKANIGTKEAMLNKLIELEASIGKLNEAINIPIVYDTPDITLNTFNSVRVSLENLVVELDPDPNNVYTNTNYVSRLEEQNKLSNHIRMLEETYRVTDVRRKQLEVQKKESNVTCPNCNHNWYLNFNEQEYQGTLSSLDKLYKDIETIKNKYKELTDDLVKHKVRVDSINTYEHICNIYPTLNQLWHYIDNSRILINDPRKLLHVLEDVRQDLVTYIEIDKLKLKIREVESAIELLDSNSNVTYDKLVREYEVTNEGLYSVNKAIFDTRYTIDKHKGYKSLLSDIERSRATLSALITTYEQKLDNVLVYRKKQSIDEVIRTIKLHISEKENLLSKQEVQKGIVANIQKTIEEQEASIEYYKAIEKAMSPTEGLIAKSLTGFINVFIKQINEFIKKVWTYPLELLEIEPDESLDVNYKFKVSVNDNTIVPDIVRLSSAQKEIVDLAVRAVSMKYLHMNEYPLYLDEFSRSMDVNHRKNTFFVINQLALTSNYSQIYLVSHYKEFYEGLKNTQLIDLDAI